MRYLRAHATLNPNHEQVRKIYNISMHVIDFPWMASNGVPQQTRGAARHVRPRFEKRRSARMKQQSEQGCCEILSINQSICFVLMRCISRGRLAVVRMSEAMAPAAATSSADTSHLIERDSRATISPIATRPHAQHQRGAGSGIMAPAQNSACSSRALLIAGCRTCILGGRPVDEGS